MPVRCEFRPHGVIVWHTGVVTDEELLDVNRTIYSHRYEEGLAFQLLELTDVDEFDVSPQAIQQLAETDRRKGAGCVACAVAPRDHAFGMSRMWSILTDDSGVATHVVRTFDEAILWLKSKGIEGID